MHVPNLIQTWETKRFGFFLSLSISIWYKVLILKILNEGPQDKNMISPLSFKGLE